MEKCTIMVQICICYITLLTSSKETFLFGRNFGVTSFAKFAKFILPYLAKIDVLTPPLLVQGLSNGFYQNENRHGILNVQLPLCSDLSTAYYF